AVRPPARPSFRLRVDPAVGFQVVDPERVACVRGNRVGAPTDIYALAFGVVTGCRVDAKWRRRAFRLHRGPLVRGRVVEPDLLTAVGEKRLFLRWDVDESVAVAALRRSATGSPPIPLASRRVEAPRARIRRRRLEPLL